MDEAASFYLKPPPLYGLSGEEYWAGSRILQLAQGDFNQISVNGG
jgi:hypothetical protein